MSKAEKFIITSDYASILEDGYAQTTVTVPSSVVIAGSGIYSVFQDIDVGKSGALLRTRMNSSKNPQEYVTQQLILARTGIAFGSSAPYDVSAQLARISPTVIRCYMIIQNPYNVTLTGEAGAETVTFSINTFIAPFA